LPGAQPLGCRAALTLLPCRRRRSWVDRPTVLWIRPMSQGRPNPSASSFVVSDSADDGQTGRRRGSVCGRGTIRRSSCWLCWRVYCPPAQARQYCPAVEHPPPARAGLFCEATLRAAALRADTPWIGRRVLAPPIDKGAGRSKFCAMLNWRSLGAAEMPFTASSDLGGQLWPRSWRACESLRRPSLGLGRPTKPNAKLSRGSFSTLPRSMGAWIRRPAR
jgi:hypothetical protein